METTTTIQFTEAARSLARVCRAKGLVPPSFRCPPRLVGVDRSIRRYRSTRGGTVSIRVRGRPWVAVAADMVEGVIVANELTGASAVRVRGAMWAALGFASVAPGEEATAA
jgi:hypothetical protein